MMIDWIHFTPGSALAGGILDRARGGVADPRRRTISGASGLLGGLIPPRSGDWQWRALAILGLIVSPLVAGFLFAPAAPVIEANAATLIVGGLLVGFGTRLGNGCTSGHGVCGLARLSPRSLAATAVFMGAGF